MAGINKVIIIGNLGQDPELRTTGGGVAICRLSVATTQTWINKQTNEKQSETEWHRITVWGKQGENCAKYLSKGRQVYVEGRLRTSSYEKEGVKRWSTEIVAEQVQFLGAKGDAAPGGGSQQGGGNGGNNSSGAPAPSSDPDDDDIPF